MSAVRWLVKFGAAAAIVLIACGFATVRFGSGLQMPATTTRDGTLITLSRYLREPVPGTVLVGSSITFRLKEEYFATPGLRNLALAGGSPVTGLEIVANQPQLPGLILVEANVLSRATDIALVERYSHGGTEPFFFRPVRAAVAGYEQRRHAPLTHEQVAHDLRRLVGQPPSDFDNRIYVDRAQQQFNAEDPTDAARFNAKRIEALIRMVEQRGARGIPVRAALCRADRRLAVRRGHAGDYSCCVSGFEAMVVHRSEPKRTALGRRCASRRALGGDCNAGDGTRLGSGARGEVAKA